MSEQAADQTADVRELRLAVVLYGGVSLAIYMHGTTKELHRLVRASAISEQDSAVPMTPSEQVYCDVLDELAGRDPGRVRTRVVVDVIAGTSAGGINGVYLAKALAHNLSQEALRDLWLTHGDIKQLLRLPERLPLQVKLLILPFQAFKTPPLDGDAITRQMYAALQQMDTRAASSEALPTLMPTDQLLELFVTTTDFAGYQQDLVIKDPPYVHDETHRHVFKFSYGPGQDDFTAAHNAGLTLAARSTMSFPGVFPPVNLKSFQDALAPAQVELAQLQNQLFRVYELARADPTRTYFIDGGVLDNRPFKLAIAAIKQRPAGTEVRRRLLYLEPDPAKVSASRMPEQKPPSPLVTILSAVAGIPRQQPILDDILAVSDQNRYVRRVRDVIEMTFDPIAHRVQQIVGTQLDGLTDTPSVQDIETWRAKISDTVRAEAGLAYATYIRSKLSGVVDRYASTICRLCDYPDDSNLGAFVYAVLREWARERLFPDRDGRRQPADDHVNFLRTFDLEYGTRRVQFVIDALSWWYEYVGKPGYPTRQQLNNGKRALYVLRDVLVAAAEAQGVTDEIKNSVRTLFASNLIEDCLYVRELGPEKFVNERRDELAQLESAFVTWLNSNTSLDRFGVRLFELVHSLTSSWSRERRADLLVRYLGFPYWDFLLYPIQSLANVGERDAIDVVRMSPLDAKQLTPLDDSKPKLAGVAIMHFGAFFSRAGRENDYLWGRLDGADRLIGLLLDEPAGSPEHRRWCQKAFAAIVEEEKAALPNASVLLEHAQAFVP